MVPRPAPNLVILDFFETGQPVDPQKEEPNNHIFEKLRGDLQIATLMAGRMAFRNCRPPAF
jgi:hypothetical protein